MNILNLLKLWPIPVLLFCLYSLYTLVEESYEVFYKNRNETDQLQFLACVQLSQVFPKKTEIDLKELRGELYDLFNSSKEYGWKRRNRENFELILNQTKSGSYLVLNRRVCFITKDRNDQSDRRELMGIVSFLPYGKTVLIAMNKETFNFVILKTPSNKIEQLIVRKKGRPYFDCDERNGRFHCLNECFKKRFRLSRYFYQSNETGQISLNFNDQNRTIQKSERICFAKCKNENCKLVKLILVNKQKEPKTIEAEPMLSVLNFCVQLFGRIFLFVGLFFDQFSSIATKIIRKLTRSRARRRKVKVVLFYLNLAIIILSLAYSGYLCTRLVLGYNAEANDLPEREITRNLIHPKTVHLAICVDSEMNDYEGKTMSEIQMVTDGVLNDALEGTYVNYGRSSFQTDYRVHHDKILFKMSFRYLKMNLLRCFPLSIHPNYQTIPSNPMLTIRFKKKGFYDLYVLSEDENLNSKSFEYLFAFQKRIVKRLKSKEKCVDYKVEYGNCTGRQNCLERCISRKLIGRYNRTTFYDQIIDRDWFSQSEWNTSQLMELSYDRCLDVRRECEEEIPDEKACEEITFEATVEIKQPDDLTREIDLQFDVVRYFKESASSRAIALDLLSMQSIFLGFTFLKLFWIVYKFIKPKWKVKNDKVIWFLICLFCSLGCSWNTIRIDDVIINGELVPTEYYEMAKRVQMPAMMFCLRIDQKLIDRNRQLTGNYLEELTRNIITESTFKSIVYLNESNQWTPFDLRLVERFFLLNMKCFGVNINKRYDRNQFHFLNDMKVLSVNFRNTKRNPLVHFMTQSKETAKISKISNLDYYSYNYKYVITHESSLYKHEDRFGFFRRYFPLFQEGDMDDIRGQLLKLQDNEPNWGTLNLPLKEEHFDLEVDEDRFEQLYSVQKQKGGNKRTNLNYQQLFVTNHFTTSTSSSEPDFSFNLVFLQKVMHSTNEVSYATLTLGLLNLLSIWLELGALDLRPYLLRLHDHFLIYLYLHLPILLLRKFIKALIFCCRLLRKFEPILYERIDSQWKDEEEDGEEEETPTDESSVTYLSRLIFLCRLFLKFFNLL